jgi:hypothetical protein
MKVNLYTSFLAYCLPNLNRILTFMCYYYVNQQNARLV